MISCKHANQKIFKIYMMFIINMSHHFHTKNKQLTVIWIIPLSKSWINISKDCNNIKIMIRFLSKMQIKRLIFFLILKILINLKKVLIMFSEENTKKNLLNIVKMTKISKKEFLMNQNYNSKQRNGLNIIIQSLSIYFIQSSSLTPKNTKSWKMKSSKLNRADLLLRKARNILWNQHQK